MKKIKLLLVLVLSLALVFTGCSKTAGQEAEQKIVSTVPSITEILFELGAGENVVGVDSYSNYPAETADIEIVGDYSGFDVEKVISLESTIVFASSSMQEEQIEQLKEADINVLSLSPTYYADIANSITAIGEALGKESEAEELVTKLDTEMQKIKDAGAALDTNPTIYYVMGIGEYGNWTSGEGSFINSVMEFAGGDCITKDSGMEWMEYPLEDLLTADPDVLVVSEYVSIDELLADPIYSEMSAVINDNIIVINPDIIERPGPRITEAAQLIYEGLAQ